MFLFFKLTGARAMISRKTIGALVTLLAILVTACKPMWWQTRQYSGDGEIRTCSNLLGSGYTIEFPEFDASKPYIVSYRISRVPRVRRLSRSTDPYVCLNFLPFYHDFYHDFGLQKYEAIKKRITATFRMTLVTAKGEVKHSADFSFSTALWSGSGKFNSVGEFFHFDPDQDYNLILAYAPGIQPPPTKELNLAVKNCASY